MAICLWGPKTVDQLWLGTYHQGALEEHGFLATGSQAWWVMTHPTTSPQVPLPAPNLQGSL